MLSPGHATVTWPRCLSPSYAVTWPCCCHLPMLSPGHAVVTSPHCCHLPTLLSPAVPYLAMLMSPPHAVCHLAMLLSSGHASVTSPCRLSPAMPYLAMPLSPPHAIVTYCALPGHAVTCPCCCHLPMPLSPPCAIVTRCALPARAIVTSLCHCHLPVPYLAMPQGWHTHGRAAGSGASPPAQHPQLLLKHKHSHSSVSHLSRWLCFSGHNKL